MPFCSRERQCYMLNMRPINYTLKSYNFNLKRHCNQKHNEIMKLCVKERKAKLQLLKTDLNSQQDVFRRSASEANAFVNARLRMSQTVAKKKLFGWRIIKMLACGSRGNCTKKVNNFYKSVFHIKLCHVEFMSDQMIPVKRLKLLKNISSIFTGF